MQRGEQGRVEGFMRRAIEIARRNPGAPFGAVLVDDASGEIVAEGGVQAGHDPTLHAEMVVLRSFADSHPGADFARLTLVSTAEPCPMCAAAVAWAGVAHVVYGSSISALARKGIRQISIRAEEVLRRTPFFRGEILGGVLREECDALLPG